MKLIIKYLSLVIFFAACTEKQKIDEIPPVLYPQAKKIKAKLEGGYLLNQLNGDTIQKLINYLGDTIITGVPIAAKGKVIDSDSIENPKTYSIPPKEKFISKIVHSNIHQIPKNLELIPVNHNSLKVISIPEINKKDNNHFIINSIGDTIYSGIPISVKGRKVNASYPSSVNALPLRFKDNAIYDIQYLDVDQGLASSYINSSLEDKNGNIWFGTFGGGVSRYDGISFTHFTTDVGLSDNIVRTILQDKKNNIWFGTDGGGVSCYDGSNFTHFTEKEGLSNNNVMSILEDKNGHIWIATWGGGVCRFNGDTFIHYTKKEGLSDNKVMSILEDKSGNLWFGTDGGGVNLFDGKKFTHFTKKDGLSDNNIICMLEDKDGNLWFGTWGGGINRYDGKNFTHFTTNEGLSNDIIRSMIEDKDGNLWFGTFEGGVNRYDGKYFTHFTENEGLSKDIVLCILEDRNGNLWFGTDGGGVSRYNVNSFNHFTKKEGLSNHIVMSILEDHKKNIWFGTFGGGVNLFNGSSFKQFSDREVLPSRQIFSIIEDSKNNIWFSTRRAGVIKYDGNTITSYTEKEGLSYNIVSFILEDNKENLWFGTYGGGINRFDGKNFVHYTQKEGLSSDIINCILEDHKGNLWFGTDGGGLIKFDGKSFTYYTDKEGLSSNYILSIEEDHKGNLWLGTDGSGLCQFDGKHFTFYTKKEGLSDNIIWSIIEDLNNNIWVSTENGLNQIVPMASSDKSSTKNKETKYKIYTYLKNDGLKGLDFISNSVYLDSKNQIWWGTGKSLSMLKIDKFQNSKNPPSIFLRQLDINEKFIDYRNIADSLASEVKFDGVQNFENYPLNLNLGYNQNHLTFRFSAIDWNSSHKIKYSYKIDGLKSTWSQASKEAKADYRNLPYGTFTFKVRAIGESGEWSKPFEYAFTIAPPWWHTWWARTAYFLLTILIISAFVRWRIANLKLRQKELETEVDRATKEIRDQKEEVEVAHREIQDSINYAKRIQTAILPPQKLVKEILPESFILYKPKDVVAGDFYWLEHLKDTIFLAAADCTGHGVPGAMVSVICNNGLNRAVREYGLRDPGDILTKTRELVIQEFEKSEEDVKDGMDISLCALNLKTNLLKWSGANNPLWIINPNRETWPKNSNPFYQIEGGAEIKPNKQAIGKVDNPSPYTTHQLELQKGDTIYIFSDGFQDQFGGEMGKKFKPVNLKKLLLSIQNKSLAEQGELLDKFFEEWRGPLEQVDDVCVIGVKIT